MTAVNGTLVARATRMTLVELAEQGQLDRRLRPVPQTACIVGEDPLMAIVRETTDGGGYC
jgi:hypothetical protein